MTPSRNAILLALCIACRSEEANKTAPGSSEEAPTPASRVTLTGAGATFQYPLQSKWAAEYAARDPSVRINYQSIGSGGGIRQVIADTVHFGTTDGPMTDEQLAEAKAPILHIPVTLGAVAVAVNLPELSGVLRLPARTLADIYLGRVTRWNDPSLKAANPDLTLPDRAIAVVHRSDGSGTTYIFVDFLSKVSPEWKEKIGVATSVAWPVGIGAKGNEGVTGLVKQTPGSLGYVELTYALQNHIPVAAIENPAGEYVIPSIEAVTAAAASVTNALPEDLRVSITNAPGSGAYPISGFSWVVVRRDLKDCKTAIPLARYLWWAVHEGQAHAPPLHYAPLPEGVVRKCEEKLRALTCEGRAVLP